MKTIGYFDKVEGKTIMAYQSPNDSKDKLNLFNFKRVDRIKEALKELKRMGNIEVYLLQGKKQRLIFSKGIQFHTLHGIDKKLMPCNNGSIKIISVQSVMDGRKNKMTKEEIVKELESIIDKIECDNYTIENIERLIINIKKI